MERISRDQVLMEVAESIAKRGTCSRLQVGVVFSREGRIISTGYNGVPAGLPHCEHEEWHPGLGVPMPPHIAEIFTAEAPMDGIPNGSLYWDGEHLVATDRLNYPGCTRAEHAERNGIAYAARYGVALDGAEMHVTHAPCHACSMSIVNAGIRRVLFLTPYRKKEGIILLKRAGIEVAQMETH